jgi:prolyl oligopeptidase
MRLNRPRVLALSLALGLLPLSLRAASTAAVPKIAYPKAPRADQTDDYHGTKITDPYRPLEDLDAPATRAWIDAENAVTRAYLDAIPERPAIRARLQALWAYERYSAPRREGSRLFYTRQDGRQNQPVLYTADRDGGNPRVLLDPNGLSADGTVALSGFSVSHDGSRAAVGLATAGSDWVEWKVLDAATGAETGDLLRWVKFSTPAWNGGGTGLYYARYDEPAHGKERDAALKNQKVYFHRLGTPQALDTLVVAHEEPSLLNQVRVSEDGRWLALTISKGSSGKNKLWLRDLSRPDTAWIKVADDYAARWSFVDSDGTTVYLGTDKDAPRYRLVAVDLAGDVRAFRDVIPQGPDVLSSVTPAGGRFLAATLNDASHRLRLWGHDGRPGPEIALPGLGAVTLTGARRGDGEAYFSFTSFTFPSSVYRVDLATGATSVWKQPKADFDPAAFETTQVFATSRDGTRVPLFLVSKKGARRDGTAPALLTGYGGFNVSELPAFSVRTLAFVERGGTFALAILRGGSEYGEDWHKGGMLANKQNVFDDFIAAGEWLVKNKVCGPRQLAITGGSNGGLLVGAVLNQRPDLFGAAVPAVGVMDMLRYHKFTIGWAWASEYGSSDDAAAFKWLYAYSPLHNLKKGASYPPTLVTTADHDDRVVPGHSFKYAAALQEAQGGDAPILIRIETRAGHGAGKPVSKQIDEAADVLAFLDRTVGASAQ